MFAGGDQTKSIEQGVLYFGGQAFTQEIVYPEDMPMTRDEVVSAVTTEVQDAYAAVGDNLTQLALLENAIKIWYGQPYFRAILTPLEVEGRNQPAVIANDSIYVPGLAQAGNHVMCEYGNSIRMIKFEGQEFPVAGENSFLDFMVGNITSGVAPIRDVISNASIPPPEVMELFQEFSEGNIDILQEMVRLYGGAMFYVPLSEQGNLETQKKVGNEILDYAQTEKGKIEDLQDIMGTAPAAGVAVGVTEGEEGVSLTATVAEDAEATPEAEAAPQAPTVMEKLHEVLIRSYSDYVYMNPFEVSIVELPYSLVSARDATTIAEIRRLFIDAEREVTWEDGTVKNHIAGLSPEDRMTYMGASIDPDPNSIRGQIATQLSEAIAPKITELYNYDVIVEYDVTDEGATVNITDIKLVKRTSAGQEVPELLLTLLNANESADRYYAIRRIWGTIIAEAPKAANPGELQNALVSNLVEQLQHTPTSEMVLTYVRGVDKEAGHVDLAQAPSTLIVHYDDTAPVSDQDAAEAYVQHELYNIYKLIVSEIPGDFDADALGEQIRNTEVGESGQTLNDIINEMPTGQPGTIWGPARLPSISASNVSYAAGSTEGALGSISFELAETGRAQAGGSNTIGSAHIGGIDVNFVGVFEGFVGAGGRSGGPERPEGQGNDEYFVGFTLFKPTMEIIPSEKWKVQLATALLAVTGADNLTSCGEESLCIEDGDTNYVRFYNAYLKVLFDMLGKDDVGSVTAGFHSNRFPWNGETFNSQYNLFGFADHPAHGSSTALGVRTDLNFPLGTENKPGYTTLTASAIIANPLNIIASSGINEVGEEVVNQDVSWSDFTVGASLQAAILLHPDSKLKLNAGLSGYLGIPGEGDITSRITVNGGLDVQPHKHVILSAAGYYSRENTNDNPDSNNAYGISGLAAFPVRAIKGSKLSLTPFVNINWGSPFTGMATIGDPSSLTPPGEFAAGSTTLALSGGLWLMWAREQGSDDDVGGIGLLGSYSNANPEDNSGREHFWTLGLGGVAHWK